MLPDLRHFPPPSTSSHLSEELEPSIPQRLDTISSSYCSSLPTKSACDSRGMVHSTACDSRISCSLAIPCQSADKITMGKISFQKTNMNQETSSYMQPHHMIDGKCMQKQGSRAMRDDRNGRFGVLSSSLKPHHPNCQHCGNWLFPWKMSSLQVFHRRAWHTSIVGAIGMQHQDGQIRSAFGPQRAISLANL